MRLHRGQLQESSRSFSFYLENSSTTPPMKQTCSDKGIMLLVVREGEVAPLISHVLGVVLTWVMLFVNGRGALPTQHREKSQGNNLNLHFSRENFEGLKKTREYYLHNMMVTIFWYNSCFPLPTSLSINLPAKYLHFPS